MKNTSKNSLNQPIGFDYLRSPEFKKQLKAVFEFRADPEQPVKKWLILLGLFLTPLMLIGALLGFVRAYKRIQLSKDLHPSLYPNPPIIYVSMALGALMVPVTFLIIWLLIDTANMAGFYWLARNGGVILIYLIINGILSWFSFIAFKRWRNGISSYLDEKTRFGTARFAQEDELKEYEVNDGFWIGGGFEYNKQGHLLTVAGTRGGKGVNIILPNLLKMSGFNGSWVVVDPKGENAAISARIQKEKGRKVIFLNPWNLLGMQSDSYNPLDLLDATNPNVIDDVQLIAETIVPTTSQGDVDHFNAKARSIITALILHLITSEESLNKKHLGTIWQWLRMPAEEWTNLLTEMVKNNSPHASEMLEASANEILALMQNGAREYASVISTAQKWTDFIKSPALRKSMTESSFTIEDLISGNCTLYVIIPADRLKTHYQWLRLVISALMRSVIRKPKNRVCFLLDEFYALGYLSEIDIALGAYAGYGVSVWAILQNLVQLRDMYGNNWENFISSCGVRHFFNLNDNTTLDYLSKLFGQTSIPSYDKLGGISGATARSLITADELRRASSESIFTLLDQHPVTYFKKMPYYNVLTEGKDFDPNPYYKK